MWKNKEGFEIISKYDLEMYGVLEITETDAIIYNEMGCNAYYCKDNNKYYK